MANIDVKEKCVLITGGATGLGEGMVNAFDEAGAHGVILDYRSPNRLLKNWEFVECDLTDENAVKDAFESIKKQSRPLDILLANAGVVPKWSSVSETPLLVWDQVMAVNSRGLFLTLKYGFDLLRKPGGSVVVTASINSWKGDGNIIPYVASKHAALGIVRSAALDFGKYGIRVNALGPGPIETEALLSRIRMRTNNSESGFLTSIKVMEAQTALGRLATVDEVANAALFLSSDMANGITGQIINVDAGLL